MGVRGPPPTLWDGIWIESVGKLAGHGTQNLERGSKYIVGRQSSTWGSSSQRLRVPKRASITCQQTLSDGRLCGRVSRRVLHLLLVASVHPLHLPQPPPFSSYHQSRHGSRVCSDVAASSGPTPTSGRRDRTRQVRTVTWYPWCRCLRIVPNVSGETIHISSLALLKVRLTVSCIF